MFESLLSIESLVALSVGAIFSFKISRVNLQLQNNIREQSPDVRGDNNVIIYNQAMTGVQKEMAFSVKICAVVMMVLFHLFPAFFLNLLLSLSFLLPAFCAFGVINTIRLNGVRRGWDVLYLIASVALGVIFYCSVEMMVNYLPLYPQLISRYELLSGYGFSGIMNAPEEVYDFFFIVLSSVACPALIISGFYMTFAYTVARDGNHAFRYALTLLCCGYFAYIFLSGIMFSPHQTNTSYFMSVLTYPLVSLFSLFSF